MSKPKHSGGLTLRGEFVLAVGLVALGWLSIRALAYLMLFLTNHNIGV
jgi:hypothetical protein